MGVAHAAAAVVVAHQSSTYAKSVLKHHTPVPFCRVISLPFTEIASQVRLMPGEASESGTFHLTEVVPGLVEVEVAVPRLIPAVW